MREATIILFTIIMLSLVAGLMYNTIAPQLKEAGLIGGKEAIVATDGGIFVSKDEGFSWVKIGAPQGMETFLQSDVFAASFDPGDENKVYLGASSGLYAYNQMGDSISAIPGGAGIVRAIAVDPFNKERIYLAVKSGSGGKILKTTRQYNFYEIYSTTESSAIGQDDVLGVWINGANPNIVYAGTESGLFLESMNFGESWSVKGEFRGALRMLELMPGDPSAMYAIAGNSSVFKTQNGGVSWVDISSAFINYANLPEFYIEKITIDPHNASRIYAATNKGLFRSINGGASFSKMELLSADENPRVSYVALDPLKANVIYFSTGLQIHKTEDGGRNWKIKTLGGQRGVSVIKINPKNPKMVVVGLKTHIARLPLRR